MAEQVVFKAGNSEVVAIPAEIRRKIGIKAGSKVVVEVASDGKTLIINKTGSKASCSSVTPEFARVLEGVNKRYGSALAKLAKL